MSCDTHTHHEYTYTLYIHSLHCLCTLCSLCSIAHCASPLYVCVCVCVCVSTGAAFSILASFQVLAASLAGFVFFFFYPLTLSLGLPAGTSYFLMAAVNLLQMPLAMYVR